jgi:hydroxyacylglutathione hydrolase
MASYAHPGSSNFHGNAAYLREKFGAKIGIHAGDAGMIERGDMGWNRKKKSDRVSLVFGVVMLLSPLFVSSAKFEKFKPDLLIDETFDLSAYGWDARIIHLPGRSRGSIGVLTRAGELLCGDFLYNMAGFSLINDLADHRSSIDKTRKLDIKIVYPGHGKPISIERLRKKYAQ